MPFGMLSALSESTGLVSGLIQCRATVVVVVS